MIQYTTPKGRATIAVLLGILFAFLLSGNARAQELSTTQSQTSQVQGSSASEIASGAVTVNSYGAPEAAVKRVVNEQTGTATLKTVGNAMAPSVYNASGTYSCFGGASAAVGVVGAAVGGGVTVGQDDCYRLHVADKLQQRASAAAIAAQNALKLNDTASAQRFQAQAEQYTKAWDGIMCQFTFGKAAYEAANMLCPGDQPKPQGVTLSQDPEIRKRQIATGK